MDLTKPSKSSSRVSKPLKRGRACMNCRFLKIKCDGNKPVCGPCEVHPRDDECEYADGPGRSRTKVLEDTVSRLEARLLELEKPESSTPSVMLHDPYYGHNNSQRLSISPPLFHADSPTIYSPFSPTSTTSSLPSGRHWQTFSALEANTESTGSSGSSSSNTVRRPVSSPFLGVEEPSLGLLQSSLDKFLLHAEQFGFFLHITTFRLSALLAFPLGHSSRPTPGLLHTVHLFGTHFLQPEALHAQEGPLLTRAVQYVATDPLGSHPHKIIHTLQAEVLLAYYFLRTGMLLEAKHRTGAAVSLAVGAGLHKIRAPNTAPSTIGIMQDQPYSMPPARDSLQEAERINGFWAVLTLHKFVTVALEPPQHVCGTLEAPGMQIDTPWPIDMSDYKEGTLPHDLQGNLTVRAFLNGYLVETAHGDTLTTLVNKAAILFHRAAHLTGQWRPTMPQRDSVAYDAAARSVNALIESFRANLAPLPPSGDPSLRTKLLIHALVEAASIKLHWIFSYAYSSSKQICLSAASNMVNYGDLNLQDIGYINPIMGNLWMSACLVFIDEISRVRQLRETWPDAPRVEDELMENYRNGLKAMSLFSQESNLMRYQLTKVQEAFGAI
ncbi:hypothetical protein BYT27DRAFT_7237315 [Phlegmacium glaucopus]|nr:hypothetical protein BYT27DRAFT_7237315 [Phlegmacium glaucopus]